MSTRPSHGYYRVEYDGDLIVEGSRDPEHDLARALLARGLKGKGTMLERAANVTVEENGRFGPRFVKWKPYPEMAHRTSAERLPTAEDDLALPTIPPEANEAA